MLPGRSASATPCFEENVRHRRPVLEHQDYDVGVSHSVDRGVHDTGPEGRQDIGVCPEDNPRAAR